MATQHWRIPNLPSTDPRMWCTRCNVGFQEGIIPGIIHCIWDCHISCEVWLSVNYVLFFASSGMMAGLPLHPMHIFFVQPFLEQFHSPHKNFWSLSVVCSFIWTQVLLSDWLQLVVFYCSTMGDNRLPDFDVVTATLDGRLGSAIKLLNHQQKLVCEWDC